METDKIRITLGDWMWNASVVGFINIIGEENINYVSKDTIEFSKNVLNEFENKYFSYLIETYKETLSWYKIVDFKNTITYFENNEFNNFDLKSLKQLNKYIKDTIKYYIKSASYKSVYELIDSKIDILEKEKEINTIKEPKNDEEFQNKKDDIISEVKKSFDKINEIIDYCSTVKGKKYLAGSNVKYVFKNSWADICFLNRQTKEKDIYIDYKKYFVDPAMEYIDADKKKYKYSCFTCNKPIKDLKNDLSFLKATGFDVERKSSHVWNFTNDIAVCPICKLIYSCMPAGMVYVYDNGIYINANFSIKKVLKINNKLKTDILVKNKKLSNQSIYRALINSINEQVNEKIKYELADIQVVRFENGSYRFNILARKTIEAINKSESELNHIINAGFKEIKINYNIYELVVRRIFNNQNLYTLIHKTILYKLTNDENCYYNMSHVENLLYINKKLLGGMGYMQNVDEERDIIKESKSSGYHLREQYKSKEADNKLSGISYRLLNALKTDNKDMFMDVTLNCYLYVRKEVPRVFMDALKDDDSFKTIGYAFVAGLIDEKKSKDSQSA